MAGLAGITAETKEGETMKILIHSLITLVVFSETFNSVLSQCIYLDHIVVYLAAALSLSVISAAAYLTFANYILPQFAEWVFSYILVR